MFELDELDISTIVTCFVIAEMQNPDAAPFVRRVFHGIMHQMDPDLTCDDLDDRWTLLIMESNIVLDSLREQ